MTAAKSTSRRRRTAGASTVPKAVADWFAGQLPKRPMRSMAFPGWALLPEWWAEWAAEHPGTAPPIGSEWLTDPTDRRHRIRPDILATARSCAHRGA